MVKLDDVIDFCDDLIEQMYDYEEKIDNNVCVLTVLTQMCAQKLYDRNMSIDEIEKLIMDQVRFYSANNFNNHSGELNG